MRNYSRKAPAIRCKSPWLIGRFAELSNENRALLDVIRTSRPASISELADITGRKQGNLSRTLKTMSRYGLVKMEKNDRSVRPMAQAKRYQIMV